jgi:hypothetical protein
MILPLGGHIYMIPEVVPTTIPTKLCRKVISHIVKFILLTILDNDEQKDTTTTVTLSQDLSIQQKHILEEHKNIVASPTGVPPHYLIQKSYKKSLHTPHITPS